MWAALFQTTLAMGLGLLVANQGERISPPELVPRGWALALLFLLPAAVGVLGARGRRPSLLVAAAILAWASVLLSYVAIVFAVPGTLFLVAAISTAKGARPPSASRIVGAVVLAACVSALGIGAGVALLVTTEGRCWTAYSTPAGLEYRMAPYVETGGISLSGNEIAAGCDSGELSLRGVALAAVLGVGAIAFAGNAVGVGRRAQRRDPDTAEDVLA